MEIVSINVELIYTQINKEGFIMNYQIKVFEFYQTEFETWIELHARSKKELLAVLNAIEDFNVNVEIIDTNKDKQIFNGNSHKALDFAKGFKEKKEFTLREIREMIEDGTLEGLGFSKETIKSFKDSVELAVKVNKGDLETIWCRKSEIIE